MVYLFLSKSRAHCADYARRVPHAVQNFFPGTIGFPQAGLGHLAGCGGATEAGAAPTGLPHFVQNFLPSSKAAPQDAQTFVAGAGGGTASNLPPHSAQKAPESNICLQFAHCSFPEAAALPVAEVG
jgi:hypothetical protein